MEHVLKSISSRPDMDRIKIEHYQVLIVIFTSKYCDL